MKLSKKQSKSLYMVTGIIVCLVIAYFVLPILLLGKKYIFTIHDFLDSQAGIASIIHDNDLYFKSYQSMPVMNGISSMYFKNYSLVSFLDCVPDFLTGQRITRVVSVLVGFILMFSLLRFIFDSTNTIQNCLFGLVAVAYAVTPCAPNREIPFAFLPFTVLLFLYLREKPRFSYMVFGTLFIPFVASFNATLVFELCLWFCGVLLLWIRDKKINKNLVLSFAIMCLKTILLYNSIFIQAFTINSSNRPLLLKLRSSQGGFSIEKFKEYLIYGQYHAPTLCECILLPILLWGFCYLNYRYFIKKDKSVLRILMFSFMTLFVWILSALMMTLQETGFQFGILLLDGFQWGRLLGIMRLPFYIMMSSMFFIFPKIKNSDHIFFKIGMGLIVPTVIVLILLLFFHDIGEGYPYYDNYINIFGGKRIFSFAVCAYVSLFLIGFSVFIFRSEKMYVTVLYAVLIIQLVFIGSSTTTYNDTVRSVIFNALKSDYGTINVGEFFSEELFDEIKKDIDYDGEWVVAYGFHPSVLMYNGFHTLDGYATIHSMEWQLAFRRIIAPALDRYPDYQEYYDGWGGRMYLYGELSYEPTKQKEVIAYPLYIDPEALKEHGGQYILSRAPISNADDLNIIYINEYDMEDSLYHIYLYSLDEI